MGAKFYQIKHAFCSALLDFGVCFVYCFPLGFFLPKALFDDQDHIWNLLILIYFS